MQSKVNIPDYLTSDFTWLQETHGINEIMFESLLVSKDEARAHLKFFKRMVFISNCAVMTLGLCLIGWAFKNELNIAYPVRMIMGILGIAIFLRFCQMFVRGMRSAQALERIAQKHNLV